MVGLEKVSYSRKASTKMAFFGTLRIRTVARAPFFSSLLPAACKHDKVEQQQGKMNIFKYTVNY